MPYTLFASQMPLDDETVAELLDGETFSGITLPRTLNRFSDMTTVLRGLGREDAEKLTKAAAKSLRKEPKWQSPDGRVVVAKMM